MSKRLLRLKNVQGNTNSDDEAESRRLQSIFIKLSVHILLATIPLFGAIIYSNFSSADVIYEQTGRAVMNTLRQAGMRIAATKRTIEDLSQYLVDDRSIQEQLTRSVADSPPPDEPVSPLVLETPPPSGDRSPPARPMRVAAYEAVQEELADVQNSYRKVKSVHLFHADTNRVHSSYDGTVVGLPYYENYRFYRLARIYRRNGAWFHNDLIGNSAFRELFESDTISFTRLMTSPTDNPFDAANIVSINLTENAFTNIVRDARSRTFEDIALIAPNKFHFSLEGEIAPDGELYDQVLRRSSGSSTGFFRRNLGGRRTIVYYHVIVPDWFLIGRAPLSDALGESRRVLALTLVIALVVLAFSAFTTRELYRNLYLPIRTLVDNMEAVQAGNLDARIEQERDDEFGLSYRMFNAMTARLRYLGGRLYEEGRRKREAEVMLLQSQINPHFLYNTLDTIYWIAERNEVSEISQIALWLGRFYRLNLNDGRDMISLADVAEQMNSYLGIHQIRFREKFYYSVDLDPELETVEVPNLLVQPLVENAVLHGIHQKRGSRCVVVRFTAKHNVILLRVWDNGPGISPEKLERIRDDLSSGEFTGHDSYGLKNVHERIRLKYAGDYGLRIVSRHRGQLNVSASAASGTVATIRLPRA